MEEVAIRYPPRYGQEYRGGNYRWDPLAVKNYYGPSGNHGRLLTRKVVPNKVLNVNQTVNTKGRMKTRFVMPPGPTIQEFAAKAPRSGNVMRVVESHDGEYVDPVWLEGFNERSAAVGEGAPKDGDNPARDMQRRRNAAPGNLPSPAASDDGPPPDSTLNRIGNLTGVAGGYISSILDRFKLRSEPDAPPPPPSMPQMSQVNYLNRNNSPYDQVFPNRGTGGNESKIPSTPSTPNPIDDETLSKRIDLLKIQNTPEAFENIKELEDRIYDLKVRLDLSKDTIDGNEKALEYRLLGLKGPGSNEVSNPSRPISEPTSPMEDVEIQDPNAVLEMTVIDAMRDVNISEVFNESIPDNNRPGFEMFLTRLGYIEREIEKGELQNMIITAYNETGLNVNRQELQKILNNIYIDLSERGKAAYDRFSKIYTVSSEEEEEVTEKILRRNLSIYIEKFKSWFGSWRDAKKRREDKRLKLKREEEARLELLRNAKQRKRKRNDAEDDFTQIIFGKEKSRKKIKSKKKRMYADDVIVDTTRGNTRVRRNSDEIATVRGTRSKVDKSNIDLFNLETKRNDEQ